MALFEQMMVGGVKMNAKEIFSALQTGEISPEYAEKELVKIMDAIPKQSSKYHSLGSSKEQHSSVPSSNRFWGDSQKGNPTTKSVVDLHEVEPGIVQLTMQDRDHKNKFSKELLLGLIQSFELIQANSSYKVVILTGYDSYFASGGTKEGLFDIYDGKVKYTDTNVYRLALDCKIPVIAAMQGHGIGAGWCMGMSCDFVVMSHESYYTTNFMKFGFTPGFGATLFFPEKFGNSLAQEILFTGKRYRGSELQSRGIPFPVLPREEVLPYAIQLAKILSESPRESLITFKDYTTGSIREKLSFAIEKEIEMHEKTFVNQPEVKERIQLLFDQLSINDDNKKSLELNTCKEKNIKSDIKPSINSADLKKEVLFVGNVSENISSSLNINISSKSANKIIDIPKEQSSQNSIAIIGMSGQFPKSKTLAEFWDNLAHGTDCISEIPATRWSIDQYYAPDPKIPGKTCCKWMGVLEDIDKFDPLFFNISPAEAELMDPQQRLFLENCWRCIEDSGLSPLLLSGSRCGVFVGCGVGDYWQLTSGKGLNAQGLMGGANSILSARISYLLNLKGPCLAIDTACSSSLVAIAEACNSLILQISDLALAGGVCVMAGPSMHIMTSQAGMLSHDGRCFTFDHRANGFVPGEGVGVVLLKRLSDAVRDQDPIYGVIRGWGINQDGKTNGITAPSVNSQILLEKEVYQRFGINPETISLVEAHGTGTKLGDPIEVEALTESFRSFTDKKNYCALGSVKSNIGHLLAAAGIAGVIKILLALKYRMLPPTINFETLNEHIPLDNSPFYINTKLLPWEVASGTPRRACVSSFGFSGTNAHIVIEEYLSKANTAATPIIVNTNNPIIFVLSAKSEGQLKIYADCMKNYMESLEDLNLADIAYTLQVGREAMDYRLALLADSKESLQKALERFINNNSSVGVLTAQVKRSKEGVALFEADDDAKSLLQTWIQKRKLKKVAELWVKGLNLDWNKLYGDIKPRRINLPTYPFARERYWVPKIETKFAGSLAPTSAMADSVYPLDTEKVILEKEWKQKSIEIKTDIQAGVVVVLGTVATTRLAFALFEDMEAVQVIHVIHGGTNSPEQISADFYSISAGEYIYQQITEQLNGQKLLGVIDVTAYDSTYEQSISIESGKITLLQKLIEHDRNEGYKLLQITYQLHAFQLAKTTMQGARLVGLYRMLGAEYKQIQAVTMDSDYSIQDYEKLAKQIQKEFLNKNKENLTECCYRNDERYEPQLTVVQKNDEIQMMLHIPEKYSNHDVVLITGGSRGIGASIAEHVVSQGVKNLVIMGREDLPKPSEWKKILESKEKPKIEGKLRFMQSLVNQGVRVHYYNTPLTDQEGIRAMVHYIRHDLGPITGVFHCAGLASKNPAFFKKPLSDIEAVCEPKIKGLVTLHKALEKEPLNFFILFSSISSIVPTLSAGQSDYAMANAYMDYYALHQSGQGKSYFKSIQWPAWGETGMASGGMRTPAYVKTGLLSHTTADGLVFLDIIKKIPNIISLPCVVIPGEFTYDQLLKTEVISIKKESGFMSQQLKPKELLSQRSQVNLRASISKWLREFFISELKLTVDQLDEYKPFNEYGVDSIILAQLTQTMQERLIKNIDPSLFLEYSTIAALTDYFVSNHAEAFPNTRELETGVAAKFFHQKDYISNNNESFQLVNADPHNNSELISVNQQITNEPRQSTDDIAVIGLSCRLPGAPTKEAYWGFLTKGLSAIKPLFEQRWISKDNRVDYGGWVDDISLFDSKFFNINEHDAIIMDPQARVILEESLKVIYDAGYEHKQLSGEKIGVYIGGRLQLNMNINTILQAPNPILGLGQNYLATNISRFFNFKGPSMVVDTACSSGITSMLFASDSLRTRRIDMALVGAVSLLLNPVAHDMFAARNILSNNREFHIFDKRSSGEVLGEGAGVVMLKRLSDAIKDGNNIYGIIKAISVNNDGRTLGPGSPNINAQKQVIQDALRLCGKQPEDIGYIEVNGGGTPIIDSIEIKALSDTYHLGNRGLASCYIGSVKPNIGHLLLVSGLAGFIRCVLSVYHKKIPPFLSALDPFDYFNFSESRIRFNRETIDWEEHPGKKRIAAQNSFPDGGTNCHVIVEEFVPSENYRQQYYFKTVPNMVKKHISIFPLSFSQHFHSSSILDEQEDHAGININNFKEHFNKQLEQKVEHHLPIKNFWGKYNEKNI